MADLVVVKAGLKSTHHTRTHTTNVRWSLTVSSNRKGRTADGRDTNLNVVSVAFTLMAPAKLVVPLSPIWLPERLD